MIRRIVALGLGCWLPATLLAAPVAGRVFDTQAARVFAGAALRLPGIELSARTDQDGFFHLVEVPPGTHQVRIDLPDGRSFSTRLTVGTGRGFVRWDIDYSRIVPPDEDDEY